MIDIAVDTAARRVPVVAATEANCARESIILTKAAQAAGATAAFVTKPHCNKLSREELYRHYSEIARAVDLPLIVEIDSSHRGDDAHLEDLARLVEIPNVIASEVVLGGLAGLAGKSFSRPRGFYQLSGDDEICVLFRMAGGHGSISKVANAVPKLWAEMHQACDLGDWGRATAIERRLLPLMRALQMDPNPGPVKYALSFLRPWFGPNMRRPLAPVSNATTAAIVKALKGVELLG